MGLDKFFCFIKRMEIGGFRWSRTKEETLEIILEQYQAVFLSMQDRLSQLNTNMERLIEQITGANNKHYGYSVKIMR